MSSMTLQMPMSFVDVDRDEMEYVDGGAKIVNYWWGWASDLTPDECGKVAEMLEINKSRGEGIGALGAVLAAVWPVAGAGAIIASVFYSMNVSSVIQKLKICKDNGRYATLCKNLTGYSLNIW